MGDSRVRISPMIPSRGIPHRIASWAALSILILFSLGCESSPSSPESPEGLTLTILYTNDEHGWIEEGPETDGAAKLMGIWTDTEAYRENGPVLVVSGGDNWTGPAISTWFEGKSTVDVMNAMGYAASAIGNHEFDFTLAGIEARVAQANFPYLAANIRLKSNGEIPGFVTPFTIEEVGGVSVGIVGLSSLSTPWTTFPTHVESLDFLPYEDALTEWVPRVWEAGADLIMVAGHICQSEMIGLVSLAGNLGVSIIGGGHCHQKVSALMGGVALVEGGWRMEAYGKVVVTIDPESLEVIDLIPSTVDNRGGSPNAVVEAVVSEWQDSAAQELFTVIGYAQTAVSDGSASLNNLITDSWLFAWPSADIVMTNAGGIRQGIPPGDITLATIVGILPFQNNLLELDLTGQEVVASLVNDVIVAGLKVGGGYFHSDGSPLKMDSVYQVVTTDYLYARDDYPFSSLDPTPTPTGLSYYQPTLLYLESLETTPTDPLDNYLDPVARR